MVSTGRSKLLAALYAAVFLGIGFLIFFRLDGRLLWGDEAETALLAKNVLKYGVPKTFDGTNRVTIYGAGIDGNQDDIWIWSPWLQQYVAAASLGLFGNSAWAARAPFAFAGLACVMLLGWVAHRIYRNHWLTFTAILLLGTSELFLLHARQCRYYSISVLAEITLIYGVYQLLHQNRKGVLTVALALVVQFYSNYIIAAANIPGLLVLAAVAFFTQRRRITAMVAAALSIVFVVSVPWLFYVNFGAQTQSVGTGNKSAKLLQYLLEFHFHFLPWMFLLLPLTGWFVARQRVNREVALASQTPVSATEAVGSSPSMTPLETHLLILLPLYIGVLTILPDWFLRYLLPMLPVACLLTAAWLFRHVKWRCLAIGLVVLQCCCNVLACLTAGPWRFHHQVHSPLLRFVQGNSEPYTDRISEIVRYLNREARAGHSAFSFDPEFALILYTGLKVTDGRLNGGQIPTPLPEWIFQINVSGLKDDVGVFLSGVATNYYDTITLTVPNTRRDANIPEPDVHQYHTAPTPESFVIYRKKAAKQ